MISTWFSQVKYRLSSPMFLTPCIETMAKMFRFLKFYCCCMLLRFWNLFAVFKVCSAVPCFCLKNILPNVKSLVQHPPPYQVICLNAPSHKRGTHKMLIQGWDNKQSKRWKICLFKGGSKSLLFWGKVLKLKSYGCLSIIFLSLTSK